MRPNGWGNSAWRMRSITSALIVVLVLVGVAGFAGLMIQTPATTAPSAVSAASDGGAGVAGQSHDALAALPDSAANASPHAESVAGDVAEQPSSPSPDECRRALAALPDHIPLDNETDITPVGAQHEPDTVLLSVSEGTAAEDVNDLLSRTDFVSTKDVSDQDLSAGFVKLALVPGTDVARAVYTLEVTGAVEGAQPNYIYHLQETTTAQTASGAATDLVAVDLQPADAGDSNTSSQWALDAVQAPEAWEITTTDNRVTVAVIDNGCIVNHEDLEGNIIASYNAVKGGTDVSHAIADYHGTHVAGIIAATANNVDGIKGVSYNANLLPIQAFSKTADNKEGADSTSLKKAFNYVESYASTYNIKVVNMSVGAELTSYDRDDRLLINAINQAYSHGIVTVCAAGNKGADEAAYTCFPVDYSDKIVGVINLEKNAYAADGSNVSVAPTSNYNMTDQTTKDVSAPGSDILSTYGPNTNSYTALSGTSMATPLVSGILALEFTADPGLSAEDAIDALHYGAEDLNQKGWDEATGYGMVNAYRTIQALKAGLSGSNAVAVGDTIALKPTKYHDEAWVWEPSDPGIATVDQAGVVTGLAAGTVTITATYGDLTAEKTVVVHESSLSGGKSMLVKGGWTEFTLTSTLPAEALWRISVSDPAVASVSSLGNGVLQVTGKSAGTATITARNNLYDAAVSVEVSVYDLSIVANDGSALNLSVLVGDTLSLHLSGQPEGDNVSWEWSSSNADVCSIAVDEADSSKATLTGLASGIAVITVALKGDSAFRASTTLNVAVHDLADGKTAIQLEEDTFTYVPNTDHTPGFTVTYDGAELPADCYSAVYSGNRNAGTATLTLRAENGSGYLGSATAQFTIEPAPIDDVTLSTISDKTYTGSAILPTLTVGKPYTYIERTFFGGSRVVNATARLSVNSDYTLSYADNKNVGTATVTVTGIGNYTGTTSITFAIKPASIASAKFDSIPSQSYTGSAIVPTPSATYRGLALKPGTDFTFSHNDNVKVGWASVAVTGTGNFTGSRTLTFYVTSASLANAAISPISNQLHTGKAITPALTVTLNGKTLALNKDYRLSYSENVNVGTATVAVEGAGNYTGRKVQTFQIVTPSVVYRVRMHGASWQNYVGDGDATLDTGKGKREGLKAVSIRLGERLFAGSVKYRVRVKGKWGKWKKNGATASVGGSSKRMTGLQVKLTGGMAARYNVVYRAKVKGKGWTAWKSNGATAAHSKSARITAIQIILTPK